MFKELTMNDIYETHIAFRHMPVVLEEQLKKREQASKAYDTLLDWQIYMKDKP